MNRKRVATGVLDDVLDDFVGSEVSEQVLKLGEDMAGFSLNQPIQSEDIFYLQGREFWWRD
jgi:hypothetical protein